jgi:hypothetical protein
MKTLTVKNLSLQFDCSNEEDNMEVTQEMIDSINEILTQQLPDSQAQILGEVVKRSDIEYLTH